MAIHKFVCLQSKHEITIMCEFKIFVMNYSHVFFNFKLDKRKSSKKSPLFYSQYRRPYLNVTP